MKFLRTYFITLLFLLASQFVRCAEDCITVTNGLHTLFQHPVSLGLTETQADHLRNGYTIVEYATDGTPIGPVAFAIDATGDTPQLCWNLSGETAPKAIRNFRLTTAAATAKGATDLSCTAQDGFITVQNSFFQIRHPLSGNGGFPQTVQYRESGYNETSLAFFDRLFEPNHGIFWLWKDHDATAKIIMDTPERVVVETQATFVDDGRRPAPGTPKATYRFIYSAYSPAVQVTRLLTRDDASVAWPEAHFLQTCRHDRFYSFFRSDNQTANHETHPETAEPTFYGFGKWACYTSPLGAFGVGGGPGSAYDRGREGFPYNIAAPNIGWVADLSTQEQSALLYFGPLRDDAWFERWLSPEAQPSVTFSTEQNIAVANTSPAEAIKSSYIIENEGLRVHFGPAEKGFPCIAVENSLGETPVRFVTPRDRHPGLWRLTFQKPYVSGNPETFTMTSAQTASCERSSETAPFVLTWKNLDLPDEPGVIDVRCTITPVANRPEVTWRIEVTNRSTAWGLAKTQFPMLAQVSPPGQGDALLPDSNWGHRLFRNSHRHCEWTYPSYKCQMQFLAFSHGDAGLYFAAHDPGARPKVISVSNAQDASFTVFAEDYAQPGSSRSAEFDFCLAAYHGDWWQPAKRYREWALANAPWTAKGPIATRQDFPRPLVDLSFWLCLNTLGTTENLGNLMEELHARVNHRPGLALHWYCWHQIPFDNSYPEYFPYHEGFPQNVLRLTSQNMLVMPYINGRLWDVDIPSFEQFGRDACALPETGKPAIEEYGSGRKLSPMCPYTKTWQDKMLEICTRLVEECHVSAIYLDQITCAPAELCFNPTHGHPIGGGTHWVDGYRTLLDRIKKLTSPKGVFLASECGAEPYMDNIDGLLVWTERSQEDIPTLPAVYSGYTIFFSNTCSDRDDLPSFRAAQVRDFLWGCQPGWNQVWIADAAHRDHFAYDAYLGYLQQAAKKFFREGELLAEQHPENDVGTFTAAWNYEHFHTATLQALQGYWWKAPDGQLLLAIANLSPNIGTFQVKDAPLPKLPAKTNAWLAERLTDTGSAPLDLLEQGASFNHTFVLEPGEVFLTTFTPIDSQMRKNAQKRAKTLAFDANAQPELQNAAAEFLFHTNFGVGDFSTDTSIDLLPGSPTPFHYTITGRPDKKCTLVLPDGQTLPAQGGSHVADLLVASAPQHDALHCELRRGNLAWRLPVHPRIVPPLEVTLGDVPEIRAGKSFLLPVSIVNHQISTANGKVRVKLPDGWEAEPSCVIAFENLQQGEPLQTTLRVSVPADAPATPELLSAEILTGQGEKTISVKPPKPVLTAKRAKAPIDLKSGENWPDAPWCTLGEATPSAVKIAGYRGNADCSVRLRLAWDEKCLYIQAEVTDDHHRQSLFTQNIWQQDCLQFALHPLPSNLAHTYDGKEREFGLALTDHTTGFAYLWMGASPGPLPTECIHATREGNVTKYQAAIRWQDLALSTPRTGDVLDFSFTANDNDGDTLRGWLEWTPGVCGGKDSSLFSELHFAE